MTSRYFSKQQITTSSNATNSQTKLHTILRVLSIVYLSKQWGSINCSNDKWSAFTLIHSLTFVTTNHKVGLTTAPIYSTTSDAQTLTLLSPYSLILTLSRTGGRSGAPSPKNADTDRSSSLLWMGLLLFFILC